MICRALVKSCKILLVDEATSNVDGKTDAIICVDSGAVSRQNCNYNCTSSGDYNG